MNPFKKAAASTSTNTKRFGMCPRKRVSGVELLNPPWMERTLQSTHRIGYLAAVSRIKRDLP